MQHGAIVKCCGVWCYFCNQLTESRVIFQVNDSIEAATPGDLSAIDNLLQACSLPVADIAAGQVEFFVSGHARQMMGCVGVEPLDGACLLRSLAVKTTSRSTGLGRRLVEYALNHAAANRYGRSIC